MAELTYAADAVKDGLKALMVLAKRLEKRNAAILEGADSGAADADLVAVDRKDHADAQVGSKRRGCPQPDTSVDEPAPSGTKRHVAAKPSNNAVTCAPLLTSTRHPLHVCVAPHLVASPFGADGDKLAPDAAETLRLRAQRIRSATEGEHAPTDKRLGPQVITHELLVVARDAVMSIADQPPKLSGKAALRLLAWTVADAMSAGAPIDKPLAETVGKRLDKQAVKVASQLEAAASEAAQARQDVENATALAELAPGMNEHVVGGAPAKLAEISAAEAEYVDLLRREVYVGFWELGLSTADPTTAAKPAEPAAVPPPMPLPPPVLPLLSSASQPLAPPSPHPDDPLFEEFEQWKQEWKREERRDLPQLLARRLGEDGCMQVRHWMDGGGDISGNDVLEITIPMGVRFLVAERARLAREHEEELTRLRKLHAEECAWEQRRRQNAEEFREEEVMMLERVCEEQRTKLVEAKGREDALRELLKSCMRE